MYVLRPAADSLKFSCIFWHVRKDDTGRHCGRLIEKQLLYFNVTNVNMSKDTGSCVSSGEDNLSITTRVVH